MKKDNKKLSFIYSEILQEDTYQQLIQQSYDAVQQMKEREGSAKTAQYLLNNYIEERVISEKEYNELIQMPIVLKGIKEIENDLNNNDIPTAFARARGIVYDLINDYEDYFK